MLLIGIEEIARYMQCSTATIFRWEREEGFPISDLPSGARISSSGLIDDWLYERMLDPGAKRRRLIDRRNRGDSSRSFAPRDPSYPPFAPTPRKSATGEAQGRDSASGQQAGEQGATEVLPTHDKRG